MDQESLDKSFQYYLARARRIESLGYEYILVPAPAKQTIYKHGVAERDRKFISRLVTRLRSHGVHALDLTEVFLKHKDVGIYIPTDTHWNAEGTRLAAAEIARYLRTLVREKKIAVDLKGGEESRTASSGN